LAYSIMEYIIKEEIVSRYEQNNLFKRA